VLGLAHQSIQAGVSLAMGEIGLEHLDFDFRAGSLYLKILRVDARVHQDRH